MSQTKRCVLTGDIVKSSALPAGVLDDVMQALARLAERITSWPGETNVRYERFRGDGWQMTLDQPAHALRACLFARAAVRSATSAGETRIGAGIGGAAIGAGLAESSGTAFERSGHSLETLKVHRLWHLDAGRDAPAGLALAPGLFAVCEEISRPWTMRQADIFMRLAVPNAPAMSEVADALGVQPQTIQTHFARAGGHGLLMAIEAFETVWHR